MTAKLIDKKDIDTRELKTINSPNGKSMPLPSTIYHLHQQADRAVRLGNGNKSKVKIIFQTKEGIKMVHTTVWAATEDFILLKGGKAIPMDAILDIVE